MRSNSSYFLPYSELLNRENAHVKTIEVQGEVLCQISDGGQQYIGRHRKD